jgi:maltooligosyltrehalose trehalohydrolase
MQFGPELSEDGTTFRIWAPLQTQMTLLVDGHPPVVMNRTSEGWHWAKVDGSGPGTRYRFQMTNGLLVPDPASRFQPDDVHGPSELIDPNGFKWRSEWSNRPWEDAVIYELHIGSFTPEGTFLAAIEKLPWLASIGITAIELMPVADFPGAWGWGYDGVLLYAPDASYGRPEHLKRLIQAAHDHGIMAFLDVVYNHFGPDGNYLPLYAPIFNEAHKTPWGAAVNFDAGGSEVVREFIIQNALYWIEEFRFDGLRLDAVHAIKDGGSRHLLEELAGRIHETKRHVHLILENEENEASRLVRHRDGRPLSFTAQWNDDLHHVLHTAATGEISGYYADYAGDTVRLGRTLAEGFGFQGELMPYRGEPRGEPSRDLSPTSFVSFIQNHDQVGNRAFGERLNQLATPEALHAIIAIYLLAPQIPMLFMGEEFGASTPFPFFCDFQGELADAVRDGRRTEFARFPEFEDPEKRKRIPDPLARRTFESAKLNWAESAEPARVKMVHLYRQLIEIRRREIVPRLKESLKGGRFDVMGDMAVRINWQLAGATLTLDANLKGETSPLLEAIQGRPIWGARPSNEELGPWEVIFAIGPPNPIAAHQ